MSEAHGQPVPDAAESDPAALNSSEDLDEDRLRVDPLEEGVEPPERYAASGRFGTTPSEEHEGEPLEDRLRQERADIEPEDTDRPLTRPEQQLDDSIDDEAVETADGQLVVEPLPEPDTDVEEDQNADKPGGSVAESFRTPPPAS
jgi:hypothetical protein